MGEEKTPLEDKGNGKFIADNKQSCISNSGLEIENAGNKYDCFSFSGSVHKQEVNYQSMNHVEKTIIKESIFNEKLDVVTQSYSQKNIKCDMEIEILE